MMASSSNLSWKECLYEQLRHRNRIQRDHFVGIFESYAALLRSERSLHHKVQALSKSSSAHHLLHSSNSSSSLEQEQQQQHHQQQQQQHHPTSPVSSEELEALRRRTSEYQEQLTQAYRVKAEHAQQLLELKQRLEDSEKLRFEKEKAFDAASNEAQGYQEQVMREKQRSVQLEATMELLRQEIASLQSQMALMDEKIKTLTTENRALVNKLLEIQNQRAAEMNEMNEMYENLLAEAKQKDMALENERLRQGLVREKKISPDIDMSDKSSILDAVAWQSNFNVSVPSGAKRGIVAHEGQCCVVRFNAAGTLLASGGTDKQVQIWDARAGTVRATLRGATNSVISVNFAPDDSLVLAAGNDKKARVYSMDTSRVVHTLTGHGAKIYASTFGPDATVAITGSHDRSLKVWDMSTGYCTKTILAGSSVNYVSLSPNGDLLAAAHLDKSVRFWSLRSGEAMHSLTNLHTQQATSVEFSRDATQVVTNSRDSTLQIIDVRTFDVVRTLTDPQQQFRNAVNWGRACFSPDGQYVVAGSVNGALYVWNVKMGKLETVLTAKLKPLPHSSSSSGSARKHSMDVEDVAPMAISCVAWNRNGRQIVSSNNQGQLVFWE